MFGLVKIRITEVRIYRFFRESLLGGISFELVKVRIMQIRIRES